MSKNEVKEMEEHKFEDVPDEEGDEKVVPAPDSEEAESKESSDEPESSTGEEEEKESESEEAEEEEAPAPSQPKPVEGEIPAVTALRKEVQRLRGQRREAKLTDQDKPQSNEVEINRQKELEEDYTPEELTKMERAIDVLAKKAGYTKQSEVQQNNANDTLQDFLDSNQEYSPQNDTEDIRWNAFQRILGSDYNIRNKSPRQLKDIFNKVHRDVNDEFGIENDTTPKRNEKKIEAGKQKIQSISHTGGTKTKSIKSTGQHLKNLDDGTRGMFKGDWSDEDFA